MFLILIPHHGIQGVDRLIPEPQHRPSHRRIQHGRNDPVRSILRNRLNRRPGNSFPVKTFGIPAYNHGNRLPCPLQIRAFQAAVHFHAFHLQALCGKNLIRHNRFRKYPGQGMEQICQQQHKGRCNRRCKGNNDHKPNPQPQFLFCIPLRLRLSCPRIPVLTNLTIS